MVQTQVDIPENLNKKLKIYKAKKGYSNLEQAIIDILDSSLEDLK